MVQVALRTGKLGEDGHILCTCGHARDIWHIIDDRGVGVGRCTAELRSHIRTVQRLCPCNLYRASGGIIVGPSPAFRTWQRQQELLEQWGRRPPGSSHHGVGRSVDL